MRLRCTVQVGVRACRGRALVKCELRASRTSCRGGGGHPRQNEEKDDKSATRGHMAPAVMVNGLGSFPPVLQGTPYPAYHKRERLIPGLQRRRVGHLREQVERAVVLSCFRVCVTVCYDVQQVAGSTSKHVWV